MYDASNRKDIRRAEKASQRAENTRIEWLRAALSTIGGRSWFYNVLSECHIFSDPFSGDALREAYLKGERNIGLRVYTDIVSHCPDQFLLMMREANARDRATDPSANRNAAAGPESDEDSSSDGDTEDI